jgi:2-polyprenyl-3-methyl-5-hydroxy-6-metoxy-1,4-benzoquinol methylase
LEEYLYPHFYNIEKTHWWYAARQVIILRYLERRVPLEGGMRVLDVGCGTGAILEHLAKHCDAYGQDFSPKAVDFCRQRGLKNLYAGPLSTYEPESPFDLITMLDVVEHVDDDLGFLKDARRLLRPEGSVLITVPAYPSLWSAHDVELQHKRRYRKRELRDRVLAAGFTIEHLTYFNSFLLPVAVGKRVLARITKARTASDLEIPPAPLNTLLHHVFEFERHILPGPGFPFGLSLLCLARNSRVPVSPT